MAFYCQLSKFELVKQAMKNKEIKGVMLPSKVKQHVIS
jgi:hypothetical protein